MRTCAVLPVKGFDRAKQRLGETLDPDARAQLAEAMVADVLAALSATPALEATIVVTGEPRAAELARAAGAELVPDGTESGQSAAAALGIERACELGAERVLLVPGDCPTLRPSELAQLLDESTSEPPPGVAIVPDRHGTGTNALLIAPPRALALGFGAGSFQRHLDTAAAAGVAVSVHHPPSLLLDVDTGSDLEALRERLSGSGAGATRTRALLRTL